MLVAERSRVEECATCGEGIALAEGEAYLQFKDGKHHVACADDNHERLVQFAQGVAGGRNWSISGDGYVHVEGIGSEWIRFRGDELQCGHYDPAELRREWRPISWAHAVERLRS